MRDKELQLRFVEHFSEKKHKQFSNQWNTRVDKKSREHKNVEWDALQRVIFKLN